MKGNYLEHTPTPSAIPHRGLFSPQSSWSTLKFEVGSKEKKQADFTVRNITANIFERHDLLFSPGSYKDVRLAKT